MGVTVNESAAQRGRLPTHDVRVLRKRRRTVAARYRRLLASESATIHGRARQIVMLTMRSGPGIRLGSE